MPYFSHHMSFTFSISFLPTPTVLCTYTKIGLYHLGGLPTSQEQLRDLASLANAAGAACCQVLGALPDETGRQRVQAFLKEIDNTSFPASMFDLTSAKPGQQQAEGGAFLQSLVNDSQTAVQVSGLKASDFCFVVIGLFAGLDFCQTLIWLIFFAPKGHQADAIGK